jgi:type II secretory pathway component PulF
MAMTLEAGVPIDGAARLALRATNNAAFYSRENRVVGCLKEGDTLTHALRDAGVFPEDYLAIVDTAEISGSEPQVFRKQAEIQNEEATRRMKLLTQAASWLVYALVAIFIIICIFQLAAQYVGALNSIKV